MDVRIRFFICNLPQVMGVNVERAQASGRDSISHWSHNYNYAPKSTEEKQVDC